MKFKYVILRLAAALMLALVVMAGMREEKAEAYENPNDIGFAEATMENYDCIYVGAPNPFRMTAHGFIFKYSLSRSGPFTDEAPIIESVSVSSIWVQCVLENGLNLDEPAYEEEHITVHPGDMSGKITASGFTGSYDGQPHSISVEVQQGFTGTTVEYSTDGADYSSVNPAFTEPGAYTVYYKVTRDSYNNHTGSATVTINSLSLDGIASVSADPITYNGDSQTVSFTTGSSADVTPTYFYKWPEDSEYVSDLTVPASKGTGAHSAYWYASAPHYTSTSPTIVSIIVSSGDMSDKITASGYTGSYDGQPHSISVEVQQGFTGATVEYSTDGADYSPVNPEFTEPGVYRVHYKVRRTNYNDVTGYEDIEIGLRSMEDNVIATDSVYVYNGGEHGINIRVVGIDGATIWYSYSENGPYTTHRITACGYGLTKVYYKVTKPGYADVTGSRNIRILVPGSTPAPEEVPEITPAPAPEVVNIPQAEKTPQGAVIFDEPSIPYIARTEVSGRNATISWIPVEDADRYEIYGAPIGEELVRLATIDATDKLTFTKKDLGKNGYKLYVRAYVGDHRVGRSTKMVVFGSSSKKTNASAVEMDAVEVTMQVGDITLIGATAVATDASKILHDSEVNPQLRFYSTNDKVIRVDDSGKAVAIAKGECEVYAVALDGVYGVVKITVK